jgi:MSHA pilin protein MshC
MRPGQGFTLIELIVVMVVMAILVAVAAPRFFTSNAFEGPAFAHELASAARYAQKVAVTSGCPVQMRLTSATHYELKQPHNAPGAACDTSFTRDVLNPGTGAAFMGDAPGSVAISGVKIGGATVALPQTVQFSALGVPSPAGDFSIVLGTHVVVIAARSGYVDVEVP